MQRRNFLKGAGAGVAAAVAPGISHADKQEYRMAMSWIKNSPGAGATAERLARRIETLSAGRVRIKIFAAGELVGPFEVLDAVGSGTADFGHSASFFWQGKMRASAFFTAVPFGLTPQEHMVWIYHNGGQQLWDELYAPFNVKPFLASNTSIGMGGWFKKKINSLDDIAGLRYRVPGLGGEVFRRIGAVAVTLPPPEIGPALHLGTVDAAEWLGPWSDLAMGFYKSAPYYYGPGFHEPNGAGEFVVNRELWQGMPDDIKQIINTACIAEHAYSLTEIDRSNPEALHKLISEHGTQVFQFPDDVMSAASKAADEVLDDLAQHDDITNRITRSFRETKNTQIEWSRVSSLPFLRARSA
ncbi:MAG: TRAP transporter substrate-binding protein [Acidiferrobacterales bacterium]|nr:TRAP transporter substrate-binding protein [Acidiferrobacterales bacterium]